MTASGSTSNGENFLGRPQKIFLGRVDALGRFFVSRLSGIGHDSSCPISSDMRHFARAVVALRVAAVWRVASKRPSSRGGFSARSRPPGSHGNNVEVLTMAADRGVAYYDKQPPYGCRVPCDCAYYTYIVGCIGVGKV